MVSEYWVCASSSCGISSASDCTCVVACEKVDVCGAFDDELRGARECDCTGAVACEKVDVCGGFDDELRGARKCDCTQRTVIVSVQWRARKWMFVVDLMMNCVVQRTVIVSVQWRARKWMFVVCISVEAVEGMVEHLWSINTPSGLNYIAESKGERNDAKFACFTGNHDCYCIWLIHGRSSAGWVSRVGY
eukprot:974022_1